ncbi:hypothetical protein ABW21_db0203447 [Orbilia brochopaga]|nr:hypothetical protein ABW21_db0203447 [Drechslerella brochopaga]
MDPMMAFRKQGKVAAAGKSSPDWRPCLGFSLMAEDLTTDLTSDLWDTRRVEPDLRAKFIPTAQEAKREIALFQSLITFLQTFYRDITFFGEMTAAGLNGPISLSNPIVRMRYHQLFLSLQDELFQWKWVFPPFRSFRDETIPVEIIGLLYGSGDPIRGYSRLQDRIRALNKTLESIVRELFPYHLERLGKSVFGESFSMVRYQFDEVPKGDLQRCLGYIKEELMRLDQMIPYER